jgi:hypothetical protein
MSPLAGPAPAGDRSRWIDLEQCLNLNNRNSGGTPLGASASFMTTSGSCPIGTPEAIGLAAMARVGRDVVVVNNPSGVAGLAATIPPSVRMLPVAVVLQVASLLRSGIRELQSPHAKSASAKSNFGTARFSLTGEVNMSWTANNTCVVTAGGAVSAPQPGNGDLAVSLQDLSAPGGLTVGVPSQGGHFSLSNPKVLVTIQLLDNNRGWIAESPQSYARKVGAGTVTATRNARSGSLNVTLKPLNLDIPRVRNALHDVHMVGSWSGCPAPVSPPTGS